MQFMYNSDATQSSEVVSFSVSWPVLNDGTRSYGCLLGACACAHTAQALCPVWYSLHTATAVPRCRPVSHDGSLKQREAKLQTDETRPWTYKSEQYCSLHSSVPLSVHPYVHLSVHPPLCYSVCPYLNMCSQRCLPFLPVCSVFCAVYSPFARSSFKINPLQLKNNQHIIKYIV